LLDRGNAWVKICGGYETSLSGGPEYADVGSIANRLIQQAPERVIWGSNWPHVAVPRELYPDDAEQLDVLLPWADESARQKILVDNPAALYGF
jgi:D-galactarolactone isomerase